METHMLCERTKSKEITLFKILAPLFILAGTAMGQNTAPPLPIGLWQEKNEGFVVRIEACNGGFCGVAAGAPPLEKKDAKDTCGKPVFINFVWNQSSSKWDGQMRPPDNDMNLKSQIDSDGRTFLKLRVHFGIIYKNLSFAPFRGKIGVGCRVEP
jgi:uncharacterized protein (DUF2147 family)